MYNVYVTTQPNKQRIITDDGQIEAPKTQKVEIDKRSEANSDRKKRSQVK